MTIKIKNKKEKKTKPRLSMKLLTKKAVKFSIEKNKDLALIVAFLEYLENN